MARKTVVTNRKQQEPETSTPAQEAKPEVSSSSGRREYDVTPEKFIQAWQTSRSAEEVSDKLGMPKPIVHARASVYRKAGVKLKRMARGAGKKIDVDSLNKLIAEIGVG